MATICAAYDFWLAESRNRQGDCLRRAKPHQSWSTNSIKGRKPKPVQRQIAEGDAKRYGVHNLEEKLAALPKAARGLPDPPAHLTGVAASQWLIWKADLELMGLDYHADTVLLEAACVAYQRAVEAEDVIRREGAEIRERLYDRTRKRKLLGTRVRNHPAATRSNAAWRAVHAFCAELGLSPASRRRLAVEPPDNSAKELMQVLMRPRVRRAPESSTSPEPTTDPDSPPS